MKLNMRRRMFKNQWLFFPALLLFSLGQATAQVQDVQVTGGFMKDSVQIGEPVEYFLAAAYPQALTVLFPDSTFSFAPFEFTGKKLFPTHTVNGVSHDSVVYYLSTFEVDKIQYLNLPVFAVSARDSTSYTSQRDSVFLIELVPNPPDTLNAQNLPLKTNTAYIRVFTQFNYIILAIVIGVLVIAAIVGWIVFGRRIIKYFKLKKLKKSHLKFLQTFSDQFQQVQTLFSREKAEAAISVWKKYLEQLEHKPYTKLTTRETVEMESNEKLGANLKMIDHAIYGNQTSVMEPLEELKKFAEERFLKKLEEIKNG
jgi:hypothetical protein